MNSRITRVALKNYKSIGSCDVELQPLTLLVGPNGSGKSNFLDALKFLFEIMLAPLDEAMKRRGGLRSILQKKPNGSSSRSFSIEIWFEVDEIQDSYSLTVGYEPLRGFSLERDECHFGADHFLSTPASVESTLGPFPSFVGNRPALTVLGAWPNFAPAFNAISSMYVYSPDPNQMRTATSVDPAAFSC